MQVTILNNQTLLDIAIQYFGTIESGFAIAVLNNLNVTDDLVPGRKLELPINDYGNNEIVNYFKINKKEPATAEIKNNSNPLDNRFPYVFAIQF